MWHVSAVPLERAINPNFRLSADGLYFLLVLMPEPVLYIWLRCEPCIRYSLTAFRQSPRQISNSTSYTFNSTFEFLFRLQWSLVETKKSLCGVGRWRPIDLLPRLFRPSCFVKKGESVGNTRLLPQAKMLLALLKRKTLYCSQRRVKVSLV